MMDKKQHMPGWKTVVFITVLWLAWYFIERGMDSLVLTFSTLAIMGAVLIGAFSSAGKDWKAGYKKSFFISLVGIVIQIALIILYIINSVKWILDLFTK